jgi:hypothetical protein
MSYIALDLRSHYNSASRHNLAESATIIAEGKLASFVIEGVLTKEEESL